MNLSDVILMHQLNSSYSMENSGVYLDIKSVKACHESRRTER